MSIFNWFSKTKTTIIDNVKKTINVAFTAAKKEIEILEN